MSELASGNSAAAKLACRALVQCLELIEASGRLADGESTESAIRFFTDHLGEASGHTRGAFPEPNAVALLFQAMPTASSAYILARQLGGNAPLMAGITAAQTVIAAGAIPLVVAGLTGLVAQ